jgi:hypothetical protein
MPRKLKKRAMKNRPTLYVSSDPKDYSGDGPKALRDSAVSRGYGESVLQGWLLPELVRQLGFSVERREPDRLSDLEKITAELTRLSNHPLGRLVYKMVGLTVPGARPKFEPLPKKPPLSELDRKCLALAAFVTAKLAQPPRDGFPQQGYKTVVNSRECVQRFRAGEGRKGENLGWRQTRNRYNRGIALMQAGQQPAEQTK